MISFPNRWFPLGSRKDEPLIQAGRHGFFGRLPLRYRMAHAIGGLSGEVEESLHLFPLQFQTEPDLVAEVLSQVAGAGQVR